MSGKQVVLVDAAVDVAKEVSKATAKRTVNTTHEPSIQPLVNHLNVIQHLAKQSGRDISFKILKDEQIDKKKLEKMSVISLSDNKGIRKFIEVVTEVSKLSTGADAQEFLWSDVSKLIFDPVLRGYLAMAGIKWINKQKRSKAKKGEEAEVEAEAEEQNVINNFEQAVRELGLPEQTEVNLNSFLSAVHDYVNNANNIKLKCFNQIFPHTVWKEDAKDAGKINNKYIQRIPPYFDELLDLVVTHSEEPINDIKLLVIDLIHNLFLDEYALKKESKKLVDPVGIQLKTFMKRFPDKEQLLLRIEKYQAYKKELNNKEMNERTITDEFKKWNPFVIKDKEPVLDFKKTINSYTDYTKDILEQFDKLMSALRKAIKFAESVIDGKLYQEKLTGSEHDLNAFYEYYQDKINIYEQFRADHANVEPTVKDILCYVVDTLRLIASIKTDSKTPLSANEFNKEEVIFRLTGAVSKCVRNLLAEPTLDAKAEIEKLFQEEKFKNRQNDITILGVIESLNVNCVDTYAKIGEIAAVPGVSIPKDIRVALGLDIMKYTLNELRVILAADGDKKSPLTVYVKA